MLIVMDIGNTNTKCGLYRGGELRHSWRIATKTDLSSDELGIQMMSFFDYLHISPEEVCGIMISSVIPSINYTVEHMCRIYFHQKPHFVESGIKTGINILYDPQRAGVGPDCQRWAAYEKYGGPASRWTLERRLPSRQFQKKASSWAARDLPRHQDICRSAHSQHGQLPRVEL